MIADDEASASSPSAAGAKGSVVIRPAIAPSHVAVTASTVRRALNAAKTAEEQKALLRTLFAQDEQEENQ